MPPAIFSATAGLNWPGREGRDAPRRAGAKPVPEVRSDANPGPLTV
ncbi:hypothetical protein BIFANG_02022 [Bifidobacterium angulatum DSM 20098 = JCM 7096]|uniref:Uncharacterized protein n=1 Tax=Bifidobacterium angulatum DSM 20098 = JCM 7096 TaxID=518635 RepID=C4FCJ6_9BIFI|nr:hypothetical protein BIFANG_02022 [Bifidobacterium angulatum DSM 20098 = JCM 7096]